MHGTKWVLLDTLTLCGVDDPTEVVCTPERLESLAVTWFIGLDISAACMPVKVWNTPGESMVFSLSWKVNKLGAAVNEGQ